MDKRGTLSVGKKKGNKNYPNFRPEHNKPDNFLTNMIYSDHWKFKCRLMGDNSNFQGEWRCRELSQKVTWIGMGKNRETQPLGSDSPERKIQKSEIVKEVHQVLLLGKCPVRLVGKHPGFGAVGHS